MGWGGGVFGGIIYPFREKKKEMNPSGAKTRGQKSYKKQHQSIKKTKNKII